jgi:hypothetical protein
MEPEGAPKICIGLAITLQAAKDGAPEDQELGLVRRPAEPLRQNIHRLSRLLQMIQQPCEVEPGLDMGRLQFEQVAVRTDRLSWQRAGREFHRLLKPQLGLAPVSTGRRGAGRRGIVCAAWFGWKHGDCGLWAISHEL